MNTASRLIKWLVTGLPQSTRRLLEYRFSTRQLIFVGALGLCLTPSVSPPLALILGLVIAQFIGHPYLHLNHKVTHWLLQASVVELGFGMNVHSALQAGNWTLD